MATSEQLRVNLKQHRAKNRLYGSDDKAIYQAQKDVAQYLEDRFRANFSQNGYRIGFANKPDRGVLYLKREKDKNDRKSFVIAEGKRQGTNEFVFV